MVLSLVLLSEVQMFQLNDFIRNTIRLAVLLAVVVGVSLFVGCRGSGRQPVAAVPVPTPPILLGTDTGAVSPLPESAQAFRPILPESLTASDGDRPKSAAPSIEPVLQQTIDDLNGKVAELEKKLAEKDEKLSEKDEELKLALLSTELPEVPKSLASATAAPRKALPVLPVIGVTGVVSMVDDDSIRIRVPDGILFQPGTMQLTAEGEDAIRNIASEIRTKYPKATLEIEGHTDSLQTDPTDVMQKHEIALLKTQVVIKYFLQSLQWTETISSSGHGFSRPIADNGSLEGRAQNNRIEIVVKGGENRE